MRRSYFCWWRFLCWQVLSGSAGVVQSVISGCGLSVASQSCGYALGGFRGASALWCGTRVGSDPQRGQPDEGMAPNGCARFLAAGLEPAQLLPRSVEENLKNKCKSIFSIMWWSTSRSLRPALEEIWLPYVFVILLQLINTQPYTYNVRCDSSTQDLSA